LRGVSGAFRRYLRNTDALCVRRFLGCDFVRKLLFGDQIGEYAFALVGGDGLGEELVKIPVGEFDGLRQQRFQTSGAFAETVRPNLAFLGFYFLRKRPFLAVEYFPFFFDSREFFGSCKSCHGTVPP
jgi:hypothetical protein